MGLCHSLLSPILVSPLHVPAPIACAILPQVPASCDSSQLLGLQIDHSQVTGQIY